MQIKTTVKHNLILVSLALLSACGGSEAPPPQAVRISGTAQAPQGVVATIEQHKPATLAMLDFLMPSAMAAITGLTPVPNASVELIRIDDKGKQRGDVLATTTTDSQGQYTLELPRGVDPASDLVVQIKGNTSVLRAIVVGDKVDIDPVSDFILDTLIHNPGVVLASLPPAAVQTLVDKVARLNIDLSGAQTTADAANVIKQAPQVKKQVTQVVTAVTNKNPIVGAWHPYGSIPADGSAPLPGMMVFYADGFYINYSKDHKDCIDGGVEYGSYSIDSKTGILTATSSVDENGVCGLTSNPGKKTGAGKVEINTARNQLTLSDVGATTRQVRVTDGNKNSIVGAWDTRHGSGNPAGFVLYPGGFYVEWKDCGSGGKGVEYGSYKWTGSAITGQTTVDENGSCGGFNTVAGPIPANLTATISNNVVIFSADKGKTTIKTSRVGATTTPVNDSGTGSGGTGGSSTGSGGTGGGTGSGGTGSGGTGSGGTGGGGTGGGSAGNAIGDGITVVNGKARLSQTFTYTAGGATKQTTRIKPKINKRVDLLEARVLVDTGSSFSGNARIETDIRLNYHPGVIVKGLKNYNQYAVIRLRQSKGFTRPVIQVFFGADFYENGIYHEVYVKPATDGSAGPLVNRLAVDWTKESAISVHWIAAQQMFVFSYNGQSIKLPIARFLSNPGAVSRGLRFNANDFSGIEIRSSVRGYQTGDAGKIAARYDNVKLDGVLYDDFSGTALNPGKWKSQVQ